MNGIINLLKPPCLSSAQAVSFIKRLTGQKTGHAGTLDPEACGVLPIMIGKATSLFDYIAEHQKVYVAQIAFGTATDTQDATGIVMHKGHNYPDIDALRSVLDDFNGTLMQVPPSFSAIKRDGKALYALARAGEMVEVQARPVQIQGIELLSQTADHGFLLRVSCGKGTYIRTLCHDIGLRLGCPAHMRMLIRERTGPFCIDEAITMEEFEACVQNGTERGPWLLSMEKTIAHLPQLNVRDDLWKPCVNGVAISPAEAPGARELEEGSVAALRCRDILIGLYEKRGGMLCLKTMLIDRENIVS